jgi:2-oxoisovalerate dehydrogenase E1 component
MGGQPQGETMGFRILARLGAGINPENAHAERLDGINPLAVAEATSRKKKILLDGDGPAILDTVTYRLSGHSATDPATYRTSEEVELWRNRDCLHTYASYLIEHGLMSESERETTVKTVRDKIKRTLVKAIAPAISPYIDPAKIEGVMFSNESVPALCGGEPEVTIERATNPRVQAIARKSRFGLSPNGDPLPGGETFTVRDGLFEAVLHRFYTDPSFIAYGEENRDWGGAFGVYRGLTESVPYHRLFNSPISEAAIIGSAVGYAMSGGRALVELMYCDFIGRAGDEIFNQMAKWQAMSAGHLRLPVTVRVSVGNRYGAQHSQDWSSMIAHIPGLKVMFPATPYDAKGMLNLALNGTDPVFFFESQRLYDTGEWFAREGVPTEYYEVPEGQPAVRREGTDVTIISIGATLYRALEAARTLQDEHDLSAEVIDLRFLNPLDYAILIGSVEKTARVVLVSDACTRGSFLNDVASNLARSTFDSLDAAPAVIGAPNWITPPTELEAAFFPQPDWIVKAVLGL